MSEDIREGDRVSVLRGYREPLTGTVQSVKMEPAPHAIVRLDDGRVDYAALENLEPCDPDLLWSRYLDDSKAR